MGMTDKQFDTLMRFILKSINEVMDKMPEDEAKAKLKETADILQKALED